MRATLYNPVVVPPLGRNEFEIAVVCLTDDETLEFRGLKGYLPTIEIYSIASDQKPEHVERPMRADHLGLFPEKFWIRTRTLQIRCRYTGSKPVETLTDQERTIVVMLDPADAQKIVDIRVGYDPHVELVQ